MKRITTISLLIAAVFGSNAAQAESIATASLSGVQVSLMDLDLNDGIAPSTLWTGEGTRGQSWAANPPAAPQVIGSPVYSATFVPFSFFASTAYSNSTNSAAGSALSDAVLSTAGSAQANQASFGGSAGALGMFTLSASTQAIFSATFNGSVHIDDGLNEYSMAGLVFRYLAEGEHRANESFIIDIGDLGYAGTASDLITLTLTLNNNSSQGLSGSLYAEVFSTGYSNLPPSAVPAPAALPLMLSGLGVVGAVAARRRKLI